MNEKSKSKNTVYKNDEGEVFEFENIQLNDMFSLSYNFDILKMIIINLIKNQKKFELLTNPIKINSDENGNVTSITCVKMELGEPDESGRRSPIEVKGSEFDLDVDMVIMSLGTSQIDVIAKNTPGLETNKWKCIIVDDVTGQTSRKEIFAGGDVTSGASTVILAMEAGKKAAKGIDEYIKTSNN